MAVKCKVIGDREVARVSKGGTVELDPDLVNIAALVAGGHVELVKAPSKPQSAAKALEADV